MDISFVIIIDNINKLERKMNFLKNLKEVQYIFIGPSKYKNEVTEKYDCKYIEDSLLDISIAYNKSFEFIKGRYVNFSYASGYITKADMINIANTIYNYKIIAISSLFIGESKEKSQSRQYKITDVDIKLIYNIGAYFFKTKQIKDARFKEEYKEETTIEFIMNQIIKNGGYYYLKGTFYHEYEDVSNINNSLSCKKEYYDNNFFELLNKIKETKGQFTDYTCIYLMILRIASNYKNKDVLTLEEVETFIGNCKKVLDNIDDLTIREYTSKINTRFNKVLFNIKYDDLSKLSLNEKGDIVVKQNIIASPTDSTIVITKINNLKDSLEFEIAYDSYEIIELGGEIIAEYNGNVTKLEKIESDRLLCFFDKTFRTEVMYKFNIKKSELKDNSKVRFYFKYNDFYESLKFRYSGRGNKKIVYAKDKIFEIKNDAINFSKVSNIYLIMEKIKKLFK